jgi:hypothetical protein
MSGMFVAKLCMFVLCVLCVLINVHAGAKESMILTSDDKNSRALRKTKREVLSNNVNSDHGNSSPLDDPDSSFKIVGGITESESKVLPKIETLSNSSVIIFTAWSKFAPNISKFKPRIDHHVAYATSHGYKYVIFVAEDIPPADKKKLGIGAQVVVVPHFTGRTDMSPRLRPLQTGWLKVEAFKMLFSLFNAPALFFYIDMDVIFYNFQVPLLSVFRDRPQSVFVQEQNPGRMFMPSHAVAIRHTPMALDFVKDWAGLLPVCPHLNMEQGKLVGCSKEKHLIV